MYKPKHAAESAKKHSTLAIVFLILTILAIIIPLLIVLSTTIAESETHTTEDMTTEVSLFTDPTETNKTEAHTVEYITSSDKAFQKDLDLLARLIHAEAGSYTCSDDLQKYVGSVALNRVCSEYYPNNLHDVVYQEGQYECVMNGKINEPATDREIRMAKLLYRVGPQLPREVVFQAEFIQGDGIYLKEQNMYFCYVGEIKTGETVYVKD